MAVDSANDQLDGAIGQLPDWIEDRVLRILEADDAERQGQLDKLCVDHPEHAAALRHWLAATADPSAVAGIRGKANASSGASHAKLDLQLFIRSIMAPPQVSNVIV